MNFESAKYSPEIVENAESGRDPREKISADIAELDIGLDLARHPQLLERLAQTGEHFADSLEMARLVRGLYGRLKDRLQLHDAGPERLMRATVLHDIGKSGPAGAEPSFSDAVQRLFVTPQKPFNPFAADRPRTIADFVAQQELPDAAELLTTLRHNGIDPETEPAIDFWRRHADWGYDILRQEIGDDIDQEMVDIVGSHHLLEGKNPAKLDSEHVPTEAHALETLELSGLLAAVDKYQAFRDRSHLDHAETMRRLRTLFEGNAHLNETLREKYRTILDALDEIGPEMETNLAQAA